MIMQGVLGGLLTFESFLKLFPEVNAESPPPGWSKGKASNVQGITVGGYVGCLLRFGVERSATDSSSTRL